MSPRIVLCQGAACPISLPLLLFSQPLLRHISRERCKAWRTVPERVVGKKGMEWKTRQLKKGRLIAGDLSAVLGSVLFCHCIQRFLDLKGGTGF